MSARDRIELLPLAGSTLASWRWANATRDLADTHWEPLGLISCGGILARHRLTGRLVEHLGAMVKSVNERKALAALAVINDPAD